MRSRWTLCVLACAMGLACVLLSSCTSCGREEEAHFPALADVAVAEVVPHEPTADERASIWSLPIVDVHVHTFNARYLPLENIMLGKRDIHWLAFLISDRTIRGLANVMACHARLDPYDSNLQELPRTLTAASRHGGQAEEEGQEEGERAEAVQEISGAYSELVAGPHGEEGADAWLRSEHRIDECEEFTDLSEDAEELLRDLRNALGPVLGRALDLPAARKFLIRMALKDSALEEAFLRSFTRDPLGESPVKLFVSHALDMGPTYGVSEGSREGAYIDFPGEQLWRMDRHQNQAGSRMIWFVGYNPFRHSTGEDHLQTVKKAIDEHGAYGIKVYPPDGYRPSRNVIPRYPHPLIRDHARRYWDSRYGGDGGRTATELDGRMLELARFAVDADVPVFVHTGHGEFEARRGYGACMSHPAYWLPILRAFPNLRLCFAHAGGEDYWYGADEGYADWGRWAVELCEHFPNVYLGFGVHDDLLGEPAPQAHFIGRLKGLIDGRRTPFSVAQKILYGSDWFMPREGCTDLQVLDGFRLAFCHPFLRQYARGFFVDNALNYLGLEERISRSETGARRALSPMLRVRLEGLLAAVRAH